MRSTVVKKTLRRAAPAAPAPAEAPAAATSHDAVAGPPAWLRDAAGDRGPLTAKQDRDRAALAHLGLVAGVVGPLIVWLMYRDRGPFTAQESKEALNFSFLPTLAIVALFILGGVPVVGTLLAILGALVWVAMALYGVMGAAQVTKGRPFRYPFNLRLLR